MKIRKCWICQQQLELSADNFYRNKSKPDGWGSECKPCHRRSSVIRRASRRKKFVDNRGSKCELCGLGHENYMFFDLDHIVPLHNVKIARGVYRYNENDLQVLCPNCHRNKTITDMKWGKYENSSI